MPDDWTMKAQILSAYDEEVRLEAYLTSERLGYPMSLLYALLVYDILSQKPLLLDFHAYFLILFFMTL